MKTLQIIIFSCLMSLLIPVAYGQQDAQFTQYLDNMLYYNPAYAGSREMMNLTAIHRQQWAGFKGAPMSSAFSLHTPLRYESIGLGFSVLNDRVGPTNTTWMSADFSYSLRFKKHKGRLSFGIKGGVNLINGDLSTLIKNDTDDQSLNTFYQNVAQPNIGAGVYYHSDQWFVGVSVPRFLEYRAKKGEFSQGEFISQRHYYFTLGGYIKASRMLKIRPSTMLKITENAPLALDLSLAFVFYDKLWLAGNYRLLESAGVVFQYQFTNQFKLGYAFEYSTSKFRNYSAGTHELMLSYDLLFKSKSMSSPRYF